MGIIRQEWIPDSWADGSFFSDGVVPTRRDSSTNGNPEGRRNPCQSSPPPPQLSTWEEKQNSNFDLITEENFLFNF